MVRAMVYVLRGLSEEITMRTLLTMMILAGVIGSAAIADDFQWQGQLTAGQTLQIRGVYGPIVATTGDTATVSAAKTAANSDPNGVTIQVVPYSGGVVICAMYPDTDPSHPNTCNPPGMPNTVNVHNNDVQVAFTVTVPPGVIFSASTLAGEIQANSLNSNVEAHANSGSVKVSTSGSVQASTMSGPISAAIGSTTWTGSQAISAGGNLDVQIPADANVVISAIATSGTITSDFPLTTSPAGSTGSSGMGSGIGSCFNTGFGGAYGGSSSGNATLGLGTVGSGGRQLILQAINGNITVHKGPASGQ
jgi:hypothetical protein